MKKDTITGDKPHWESKITGAYKITHVKSGKFYVGSTDNFYKRRKEHLVQLRSGKHHVIELQTLYNECPELHFELFLTGHDERARENAYVHEQSMLDENKNNPLMLNRSLTAIGATLPPELKEKRLTAVREALQKPEYKAIAAANTKAYRSTPEAKEKHSAITTAQWSDPEKRKAIMGNRSSAEARAANAERNREQWQDPEYRKKMLEARQSDEAREKLKQAIKDSGRTKRVRIDGVVYDSMNDAERATGILRATIRRRCESDLEKNSGYQYVD